MPSPAVLPHCQAPLPAEAGDWLLSSHLTLGPLRSAVPCARSHATHVLRDWGLSEISDSVELVVSELVTNAVIASRALAGGPFPVRFWLLSDRQEILVLVADSSPRPPGLMKPAEDTEGGRGLMLVEAVSKRWGWFHASANASEGKFVWALCEI
jgi:anti-sigma regulatory factor (Ser/Thr protein kinase)